MKRLGNRTVKVSSLKLPGDMRMRMATARVQKLATSFQELGQLQDPVVQYAPKVPADHLRLLAGRDRIAAHMLREDVEVDVLQVECTDQEARAIELTENAVRRHDYEEQRVALAELERLMGVAEEELIQETGHAPTRRKVRERVAEVTGVLPETVAKQEARLKAATNHKAKEGIETWGLELDPTWTEKLTTITVAMESLASKVISAFAASKILSERSLVPTHVGQDVRQQLQALSSLVRANIPAALCPYCKGQDGIIEECIACLATGWVGKAKMDSAPPELRDPDHLRVSHRGRITDLETGELVGKASLRDKPPEEDGAGLNLYDPDGAFPSSPLPEDPSEREARIAAEDDAMPGGPQGAREAEPAEYEDLF